MKNIIRHKKDKVTVVLGGDLRKDTIQSTKDLLNPLVERHSRIEVDFSNVEMVDSDGLGVIIALNNSLRLKGGSLRVFGVSESILGLMLLMRLYKHFDIEGRPLPGGLDVCS